MNNHPEPLRITVLGQSVSVYVILSMLLLLAAALLRFHDLSHRSLWFDEAVAANNSTGSIAQMIDNTQHRNTSPITYPLILHAVQKVDRSAGSVRLPSAVFSLLAVLVMLLMPRVGTDRRAAFIAATVLTISASQIRYAQEVRAYSLSVLLASLMIYGLLAFLNSEGRQRAALYTSLFAAPLVQYGLVLFGFAVIGTLGLAGVISRRPFVGNIFKSGIALATGGVISLILTLRHQWWFNTNAYLQDFYFNGSLSDLTSVLVFLAGKTSSLLKFLMPGEALLGLFLVAFAVYACRFVMGRKRSYELPLFLLAFAIAAAAALVHAYPLGGIRQCLYLAPATALVFGSASISIADSLKGREQIAWTGMVTLVVLAFGVQTLQVRNPYREVEDINSVLSYLQESKRPDDTVYVHFAAKPALTFYGVSGNRFVYGKDYPEGGWQVYLDEIDSAMELGSDRLWIILSHVSPGAEDFIVSGISRDWHLERKVDATKASLYLATRSVNQ